MLYVVKFVRWEIGEIVCYLVDQRKQNFGCLSVAILRGSRPKSARASSQQCIQSAADFIQIGSLTAEL